MLCRSANFYGEAPDRSEAVVNEAEDCSSFPRYHIITFFRAKQANMFFYACFHGDSLDDQPARSTIPASTIRLLRFQVDSLA